MKMVKIYGPAFDKEGNATGKLVEREILPEELAAYQAVGYKEGALTPEAIAADKAAKKEEAPKKEEEVEEASVKKSGKLPDDFPGRAALEEAGITTYAQVRKAQKADELKDVAGVGEVTLANILEALGNGS
jgi:hypothetical protein